MPTIKKDGPITSVVLMNNRSSDFHDIFQEMDETIHYQTLVCPLFEGFEDPKAQIAVFTDLISYSIVITSIASNPNKPSRMH